MPRALVGLALAALHAGLCAGCLGTVPAAAPPRTPVTAPPAEPMASEPEEELGLEPDHW